MTRFERMYFEMDFITIDFEIANDNLSSACSMGLAFVKNNQIIDKKHYYIKPPRMLFNEKMVNVHGITANNVKNAPKFDQIWEDINKFFDGSNIFVAHNAQFDMSVLYSCLNEYKLVAPNFYYMDSISISTKAVNGHRVGNSLMDRCEYFGIPLENHHNALSDAIATAELVIRSINTKKRKNLYSFCKTYSSIPIKAFSELKPNTSFSKRKARFKKINISEIAATVDTIDTNHIFFGKNFVFTGELQTLERKEAMQKVVDLGGILKSGVSSKTDYLVVGIQDKTLVGDDGLSTKEEKAYELIEKGYDIKIIKEDEFLKLLDSNLIESKETIL